LKAGNGNAPVDVGKNDKGRRQLSPNMVVLDEIIDKFILQDFIDPSDEAAIDNLVGIIQKSGFTLESLGLTRDDLKNRMIRERKKMELTPKSMETSPQKRRIQGRKRLNEQERSLSNRILQALNLAPNTPQLIKKFPELGAINNLGVVIQLVARKVNDYLHISSHERENMSLEQIEEVRANLDNLGDEIQTFIASKLKQ
jgi:hypothetical protein